jgi:hypothetical protein
MFRVEFYPEDEGNIKSCRAIVWYQRFEGTHCLHFHDKHISIRNSKSVQGTHDQGSGTHKGPQRRHNTKIEKEKTFSKY